MADHYGFPEYPKAIQTREGSVVANVMLRELREALGIPEVAMSCTPRELWERTLADIRWASSHGDGTRGIGTPVAGGSVERCQAFLRVPDPSTRSGITRCAEDEGHAGPHWHMNQWRSVRWGDTLAQPDWQYSA